MTVPAEDGIYSRIPDVVYHGDKNSLSSSGARTLLKLTPEEFIAQRDEPPNPKPQYDFGHAAHKMVLGEGSQLVRVDKDDWRTNVAKEAREKAWAHGKAPLLKKDMDLAQRMAGKVWAHRIAAKLLEQGNAEMSGYWHDDATGVRLRLRTDWITELPDGRLLIVDYKTSTTANPALFMKSAADYGYHMQAPWYIDGLVEVTGADVAGFIFIVQQKTPPFLVSTVQLPPEDIDRGRRQNRRAIELYARCLEAKSWPGYDDLYTEGLPGWARRQIDDLLETTQGE